MFNLKIKKNKGSTFTPNFFKKANLVGGFTLVETMVAVLILSLMIISLMTVVANSLFASRYSRDEITVNYLLQEAIDYIRNDRDTTMFLSNQPAEKAWEIFTKKYQDCQDEQGCYFDIFTSLKDPSSSYVKKCDYNSGQSETTCPPFSYDPDAEISFYNYEKEEDIGFQRKIVFKVNEKNPDEIIVKATVYWQNGDAPKSRSLQVSLLRW